jgi:hypothetical protein
MSSARYDLLHGDCLDILPTLAPESVHAVITDPPYGIGFSGHEWDQPQHPGRRNGEPASGRFGQSGAVVSGRYDRSLEGNRMFQAWCEAWAREAARVLTPGGYLLAFGSPQTEHRLTCGLEDAGLEIRGQIVWLFGGGFPKGKNVAKAFDKAAGHNTDNWYWSPVTRRAKALVAAGRRDAKAIDDAAGYPTRTSAWRPFIAASRQRLAAAVAEAKAVDAAAGHNTQTRYWEPITDEAKAWVGWHTGLKPGHEIIVIARKPTDRRNIVSNVREFGTCALHVDAIRVALDDDDAVHDFVRGYDETHYRPHEGGRFPADVVLSEDVAAELDEVAGPRVSGANPTRRSAAKFTNVYGEFAGEEACVAARGRRTESGPSRYFYRARAGYDERHAGCEAWAVGGMRATNPHPTPKPIDLGRMLSRLALPPGGVMLDLFAGSGSLGVGALLEGFRYIGIEREPCKPKLRPYIDVCRARLEFWLAHPEGPSYPLRPPPPKPPGPQALLFEVDVPVGTST